MSLLRRIEQGRSAATEGGDSPAEQFSRLAELRRGASMVPGAAPGSGVGSYAELKTRVQNQVLTKLDPAMDMRNTAEVRRTVENIFDTVLEEDGIVLARAERKRLFEQIVSEMLGLGLLEPLLADESITEIMVNGARNVYVERDGKIQRLPVQLDSNEHLMRIIDRIMSPLGRRVDESHPYEDARLPDGSRVNAIVPPVVLTGPCITIRKFFKTPLTVEQLINLGAISPESIQFLRAAVIARLNIVISGGASSGKTTLLNVLSGYIPPDERILTIETAAELQLRQEHVVPLEARPPNIEGQGEVTVQQLVVNALRMRPDRIVVGEIRDEAALDMLQAMNTGHDGSMTTCHSNSARDTLSRLETMTLMAGMDLPVRAIREQVASAIQLICHMSRMRDGSRRVVQIAEIQGMEGDVITLTDLFAFDEMGMENGKIKGYLRPTGLRPKCMQRIEDAGVTLPPSVFGLVNVRRV